ncbi:MAG: XdhC family protein [Hyphomonadaceae bacterium]|nr:XdhC family protein [Hyphomonadaceae bacterium]
MNLPTAPADWPAFGLVEDVAPALQAAHAGGRAIALATLFKIEGASPRPLGSQMAIDAEGAIGYVAGGCVEGDVILNARAALREGKARTLVYGPGGPVDIKLACGGRIEVLVEPLAPNDTALARLAAFRTLRQPSVWLSNGDVRACVGSDDARAAESWRLKRRCDPPLKLVIVGGDPITLAIAQLGANAFVETHIVRPKGPAAPPPIAGARYSTLAPEEALREIGVDAWTAIIAATHDPDWDHQALRVALPSAAFHVAAIGSRQRLPERLARLAAESIPTERLRAPAGIPINGQAPFEVAISVWAELISAWREDCARRAYVLAALSDE